MALNPLNSSNFEQLALKRLIYEFDLDLLKTYPHTKMKFLRRDFQKSEHKSDTETDRQTNVTEHITTSHSWVVILSTVWNVQLSPVNLYSTTLSIDIPLSQAVQKRKTSCSICRSLNCAALGISIILSNEYWWGRKSERTLLAHTGQDTHQEMRYPNVASL